jgi:hypothetical protein
MANVTKAEVAGNNQLKTHLANAHVDEAEFTTAAAGLGLSLSAILALIAQFGPSVLAIIKAIWDAIHPPQPTP